jgi:spore maturation protein CgeB
MENEVWIGVYYNLYESKRYMCSKLGEAFQRKGIKVKILDFNNEQNHQFFGKPSENRPMPYFFCSFNRTLANTKNQFFFDIYRVPNLSILVDPAFYDLNLIKSPYSIISCVDKEDCALIQDLNFNKVFFFPHAVERELTFDEKSDRPYDVVFIGSAYDHEGLKAAHQKTYSLQTWNWIQEAIEMYLNEPNLTLWKAAEWVLKKANDVTLSTYSIAYYIDYYVRGLDRFELIHAIKDAQVHVFGGTCWRKETPIKGWSQSFVDQSNVTVHPAIPFQESMEILKQSKICLNSMPFFKNGTHERIFTGLACGCLPLTTENKWVKNHFIDREELLLYQPTKWKDVNDKINYYLANENERKRLVNNGRLKVMQDHTWDNRVDFLLKTMPPLIKRTLPSF